MFKIHVDYHREYEPDECVYSITLDENSPGWETDSAYPGYGLPKELAEWICSTLNEKINECPYEMSFGYWTLKNRESE